MFRREEIKKEYARKAEEREIEFRRLEKKKRDARVKKQPRYDAITKDVLLDLYTVQKKSIREIAMLLGFSTHKISYWLLKYNIQVRNKSDAIYVRKNEKKNHFVTRPLNVHDPEFLFGVGCGAYWSNGRVSEKTRSFELSGVDPRLLRICINFIERVFGIKKSEIRISIRIKEGNNIRDAIKYWTRELEVPRSQFQKKTVVFRNIGKSEKRNIPYGVATIRVHDKRFKEIFLEAIKNISF